MSTQITIIGLGQIGASIGMALKDKKTSLHRVGYDKDQGVARDAETQGVVDQIKGLPEAIQEADIVCCVFRWARCGRCCRRSVCD